MRIRDRNGKQVSKSAYINNESIDCILHLQVLPISATESSIDGPLHNLLRIMHVLVMHVH